MRLGKVQIDDDFLDQALPEVKQLVQTFLSKGVVKEQRTKEHYEVYIMEHPDFGECEHEDITKAPWYTLLLHCHEPYTFGMNHNRTHTLSVRKA